MIPYYFNFSTSYDPAQAYNGYMPMTYYPNTMVPIQFIPPKNENPINNNTQNKALAETQEGEQHIKIEEPIVKINPNNQSSLSKKSIGIMASNKKDKKSKRKKKNNDKRYYVAQQHPTQDKFIKKNVQFNLLNQIFSYLWSKPRSGPLLLKFYEQQIEKCELFYQYFKILKRGLKRLVSLTNLQNLCSFKITHPGCKTISRNQQNLKILSISQFSKGIRFLASYYIKHFCPLSVLTSSKMRKHIRVHHLARAREIYQILSQNNLGEEQIEIDCKKQQPLDFSDLSNR